MELNLENNCLSGKVPFSGKFVAKIGDKLKLDANPELCADEELRSKVGSSLGKLKPCNKPYIPTSALLHGDSAHEPSASCLLMLIGFVFFKCLYLGIPQKWKKGNLDRNLY